ncbi:hypothetical protein BD309DRAFT_869632 [Dichomitus squalens]|uniref:Uncharacterized protein n=1 Tax=Dichomitus squalens TaxID=114155 RepID=A0A4Q9Q6F3_9APHY|nr:hypothetical protein BD309DRAFT_869632 [Dichomitus squalens]TBU62566.1 hypothetical protein BD310DRAFT_810712 [Dichomitus squalens]
MDVLYQTYGIDPGNAAAFSASVNPLASGAPSSLDTPTSIGPRPPPDFAEEQNGPMRDSLSPSPEWDASRATTPSAANLLSASLPRAKHGRTNGDDDDDYLTRPRMPLASHILRAKTTDKCQAANLSVVQTEEALAFCDLPIHEKLIDIKIHLLQSENDLLQRYFKQYHRHPDYLARLRTFLGAVLFAHSTPAYVNNITNSIAAPEYLEHHLDVVALTSQCRDDPVDWGFVKSSIANETSQMRSVMKAKLDASIKNKYDIYALTTDILMYDIRPREEHWARFAFLRHCVEQYQASGKNSKFFWPYVDERLLEIRTKLKTVDAAERKEAETKYVPFSA